MAGTRPASFAPTQPVGAGPGAAVPAAGIDRCAAGLNSMDLVPTLGHEEGRTNPFASGAGSARVLGVSSGKGGVGKSSVTVNLAVALAGAGYSVGLLDVDVYGFSVPAMMGLAGTPAEGAGPAMSESGVAPVVAFGVSVMSMGFFVNDDQPVIWRGPMLHKALEQFLADVDWGRPDFLLVDMPPGTGDVALSMSQYLPAGEVYVVTTPQLAAKRVAQRSAYMARKLNLPVRGVIENMSWLDGPDGSRYEVFGRGGGAQLSEELGRSVTRPNPTRTRGPRGR